jgi:hypothetical protein
MLIPAEGRFTTRCCPSRASEADFRELRSTSSCCPSQMTDLSHANSKSRNRGLLRHLPLTKSSPAGPGDE